MSHSTFLQNNPNDRIYPAKNDTLYRVLTRLPKRQATILYIMAIIAFFLGIVTYNEAFTKGAKISQVIKPAVGMTCCIIWLTKTLLHAFNLSIREQKRYYQLGRITHLSKTKQLALRLNLVEDYYYGFWNSTLEYYPTEVRLASQDFKPESFLVASKQFYKSWLDDNWGIVNNELYLSTVESLFKGRYSKSFALNMDYVIHIDDYLSKSISLEEKNAIKKKNQEFINRFLGLAGQPPSYLQTLVESQNGRPVKFIWGFDLCSVITISRNAYMAGYITENVAWDNIIMASSIIYYLFENFESYYNNYRMGHAYYSNDLKATTLKQEIWKRYVQSCNWPGKNLPWEQSNEAELSVEMRTGFAAYIRSKNKKLTKQIGFKPSSN